MCNCGNRGSSTRFVPNPGFYEAAARRRGTGSVSVPYVLPAATSRPVASRAVASRVAPLATVVSRVASATATARAGKPTRLAAFKVTAPAKRRRV